MVIEVLFHNKELSTFPKQVHVRQPLELNWLCFFLVVIALPVIGLIGTLLGYPSSMPVFGSVAVGLVGLTLLPGKGGRCAFADILYLRCLAAITIILLDFALLLVAARHHDLPNARFAFVKGGELTALIALCLNLLIRVEGRYGRLHVFVAGLFAMLLGFATVHGMLGNLCISF